MKNLLKIAIISVLVAFTSSVSAQKFGHIDSNELLMLMPERAAAEKAVQDYAKQLETQLQTMSAEWEAKVADYQSKETSFTDVIKKMKVKEITDLEARIKEFQNTAQEDLKEKENALLQPMIEKAKKAIEDVAKENKYTYIFDAGMGALLYKPEADDILPLVKKKLGITK